MMVAVKKKMKTNKTETSDHDDIDGDGDGDGDDGDSEKYFIPIAGRLTRNRCETTTTTTSISSSSVITTTTAKKKLSTMKSSSSSRKERLVIESDKTADATMKTRSSRSSPPSASTKTRINKTRPKTITIPTNKTQENRMIRSGSWDENERLEFLRALRLYGHGRWKEISKEMKTRTNIQVKIHAQVLFRKADKDKSFNVFQALDEYEEVNNKTKKKKKKKTSATAKTKSLKRRCVSAEPSSPFIPPKKKSREGDKAPEKAVVVKKTKRAVVKSTKMVHPKTALKTVRKNKKKIQMKAPSSTPEKVSTGRNSKKILNKNKKRKPAVSSRQVVRNKSGKPKRKLQKKSSMNSDNSNDETCVDVEPALAYPNVDSPTAKMTMTPPSISLSPSFDTGIIIMANDPAAKIRRGYVSPEEFTTTMTIDSDWLSESISAGGHFPTDSTTGSMVYPCDPTDESYEAAYALLTLSRTKY